MLGKEQPATAKGSNGANQKSLRLEVDTGHTQGETKAKDELSPGSLGKVFLTPSFLTPEIFHYFLGNETVAPDLLTTLGFFHVFSQSFLYLALLKERLKARVDFFFSQFIFHFIDKALREKNKVSRIL